MFAHHRLSVLVTTFICLTVAVMALVSWSNLPGDASRKTREDKVKTDQLYSDAGSHTGNLSATAKVREAYGHLPLQFEANQGQTDPQVKFFSHGAGYDLYLTNNDAVFSFTAQHRRKDHQHLPSPLTGVEKAPETSSATASVLRMQLAGAKPEPQITGEDELPGRANYFIGKNPQKWCTNIATYRQVRFRDVYPGIDALYYGDQRQLEYDFVVAPGANPQAIRLVFAGADQLAVNDSGELVLRVGTNEVRQRRPVLYQEGPAGRQELPGRYIQRSQHEVGFEVDGYDPTRPLIIDPVLIYSTYLGGSGNDYAFNFTLDSAGNAYVVGSTYSTDFPTVNPFKASNGGTCSGSPCSDAFVAKLNVVGSALIYSTYLGGSGSEDAGGVAVDSEGNAYVTGTTTSTDFPTANAFQKSNAGLDDAFVTKLNATGSALIYSTYLGGSGTESGQGGAGDGRIAVDSAGNAYVTGSTGSTDFPTVNPLQPHHGMDQLSGQQDVFLSKFNAAGSALVYSTYLGGNGADFVFGIAVDSAGSCYLAGSTDSSNFPTANAIQGSFGGGTCVTVPVVLPCNDGFVTKINPSGSALVFSTYLGGNGDDTANSIAVDSVGNVYVGGSTSSVNFPTFNAMKATLSGSTDAFVTKLDATGSAFIYSTYLGGSGADGQSGMAIDSAGNVYLNGTTNSTDFPMVNPVQGSFAGGSTDAYALKLSASGQQILFSTYLGGGNSDFPQALAIDALGNIYMGGFTYSTDFPTKNAVQPTFRGGTSDGFIAKLGIAPTSTFQFSAQNYNGNEGCSSVLITVSRQGDSSAAATVDFATTGGTAFVPCNTVNGTAVQNCDYTNTSGRLSFAAGDTSKTFSVLLNRDAYLEGNETLPLALLNPTGPVTLGLPNTATVTIIDDSSVPTNSQPIDDAANFVCQHYHDFLQREPDPGGASYWSGQITQCGSDLNCVHNKRVDVSNAFFYELEYQQTAAYVFRLYRAAFGNNQPFPNPDTSNQTEAKKIPSYAVFSSDRARLIGSANLAQDQLALANLFVLRPEFLSRYSVSLTLDQFVDALIVAIRNDDGVDQTPQRSALIALGSRGAVMYRLANDDLSGGNGGINNRAFIDAEYNRAFVNSQYFGYLRRDGDIAGLLFWSGQVNSAALRDVPKQHAMVCSFITSTEYQLRFSSVVTHGNAECPE